MNNLVIGSGDTPIVLTISTATGTYDFEALIHKPKINGVEVTGDLTLDELGIASAETAQELRQDVDLNKNQIEVLSDTIIADKEELTNAIEAVAEDVDVINSKIPETASETNKLADIKFVIDKIQENSAHFRGNWATYSAIPTNAQLYPVDDEGNHKPTIHDYLIVMADETQGGGTWRYTYTGEWDVLGKSGWRAEYEIKDVPFTDRQWQSINSGATVEKIEQIEDNATNIDNLNGRVAQNEQDIQSLNSSKLEVSNIKAGNNVTLGVDGNNITINSTGGGGGGASSFSELSGSPYDNTNLANALNSKQATITDLASIREGAEKGDTAIQPNDNISLLTNNAGYQNATQVSEAIGIHNASSSAHADIRQLASNAETLAKGAQQGVAFSNYNNMIQNVNTYAYDKFIIGQSIYIGTLQVPDLWVSAKFEINQPYTYISDEKFIEDLESGSVRVGRFNLSKLETGKINLDDYIKKDGDETHNGKLTNLGVVDISSGAGTGALILGADVSATTRTSGARKLARINAPTNENNLDIPTTILSFDTQGDASSTIGQGGTGIYNRIEFGGRLGATSVTAPDGIAFTVAKNHNGTQASQKVYGFEMSATQARFNVRPNYNGNNLVSNTDYATSSEAGVVKVGAGLFMYNNQQIRVQAASNADIMGKTDGYSPIVPNRLDYAVKVGVTANANALTEQEQQAARTWIGATKITVIDDD